MHFFVTRFAKDKKAAAVNIDTRFSHSNSRANHLRPRPWFNAFDGREELENLISV